MEQQPVAEEVKKIVGELLASLGLEAEVEFEDSITMGPVYNVQARDSRLLIGRQGATLHALQVLAHGIASKRVPGAAMFRFTIDVDDYRRKREWYLKETAKAAAEHVEKTGKPVKLKPMPSYERRYVHSYLTENHAGLETESLGQDPYRYVTIRPKR